MLLPNAGEVVFGDVVMAASGGFHVPLTLNYKPLNIIIKGVQIIFEPSSLTEQGTHRPTLTMRLPSDWEASFECFEACVLHIVRNRSQAYFGGELTEEEVLERYKSITKKSGDCPRNLRVQNPGGGLSQRQRIWQIQYTETLK